MATKTTNYNLTKPSGTENADIDVINANMDIIDAEINNVNTKVDNLDIPNYDIEIVDELPTSGGSSDVIYLIPSEEKANKSYVDTALDSKADKSEIPDVSGFATKSELEETNDTVSEHYTMLYEVYTAMPDKAEKDHTHSNYATKTEAQGYANAKDAAIQAAADAAGIDAANLSRIEQGRYSVGLDILSRIAFVLGAHIDLVPNQI